MMFTFFTNAIRATLLLSVALGALANPISSLDARDVFVPPVTDPKAGTVWAANSKQTVSWYGFKSLPLPCTSLGLPNK